VFFPKPKEAKMGKKGSEPARILKGDFGSGTTPSDSEDKKPKRRENSVVTALSELTRLEEDRLRQEAEDERRCLEDARRLNEDAERRLQEEKERKREEAEVRRKKEVEEERKRKQEEEVQIKAEVEKAKIAAQLELEKERLRLETENGPKGFSKAYVVPIFLVLLCAVGFFGFMFYQKSRELESTKAGLGLKISGLSHDLARVTTERDAEKSRAEIAMQQLDGIVKLNEQIRNMQAQLNAVSKPELRRVRRVVQKNDAKKQEVTPDWRQRGTIDRMDTNDPLGGIKQ